MVGHEYTPLVLKPTAAEVLGTSFEDYITKHEKKILAAGGICKIVMPQSLTPRKAGYDDLGDLTIQRAIKQEAIGGCGRPGGAHQRQRSGEFCSARMRQRRHVCQAAPGGSLLLCCVPEPCYDAAVTVQAARASTAWSMLSRSPYPGARSRRWPPILTTCLAPRVLDAAATQVRLVGCVRTGRQAECGTRAASTLWSFVAMPMLSLGTTEGIDSVLATSLAENPG